MKMKNSTPYPCPLDVEGVGHAWELVHRESLISKTIV
jgi:hypothetical protein